MPSMNQPRAKPSEVTTSGTGPRMLPPCPAPIVRTELTPSSSAAPRDRAAVRKVAIANNVEPTKAPRVPRMNAIQYSERVVLEVDLTVRESCGPH